MQRATHFALLGVVVGVLAACEQTPATPLAPSAATVGVGAGQLAAAGDAQWGALASGLRLSMSDNAELPCALGPFGLAERSHVVSTPSGHESLVCTGSTAAGESRATILTGFPCGLPSGTVTTDSRLVLTPSGHVTLTCTAK